MEELRLESRQVMRKSHCAKCHIPNTKDSKPLALKIFTLDQDHWSASMSDVQLNRLAWALKDATPAEIKAMGADPKENSLSKKETKLVLQFVDRELKKRVQKPEERFVERAKESNPTLYNLMIKK